MWEILNSWQMFGFPKGGTLFNNEFYARDRER